MLLNPRRKQSSDSSHQVSQYNISFVYIQHTSYYRERSSLLCARVFKFSFKFIVITVDKYGHRICNNEWGGFTNIEYECTYLSVFLFLACSQLI